MHSLWQRAGTVPHKVRIAQGKRGSDIKLGGTANNSQRLSTRTRNNSCLGPTADDDDDVAEYTTSRSAVVRASGHDPSPDAHSSVSTPVPTANDARTPDGASAIASTSTPET